MLRFASRLKHLNSSSFIKSHRNPLNRRQQICLSSSETQKSGEVVVSRRSKYIVGALFIVGGLGFAWYVKHEKEMALARERQRELKRIAIPEKWELVDSNGQKRTPDDFYGKWCIIYFGFTHCPDICPDEMEKMVAVVNELEKSSIELQPIFVTVDPVRDSQEVVGKYVKEFSPKIIGLTGTPEQIQLAGIKFHVYFKAGPKDKEDDYIVDHTIILYLVDPNGDFIDFYGLGKNKDDIVESVKVNIEKWNKLNSRSWLAKLW